MLGLLLLLLLPLLALFNQHPFRDSSRQRLRHITRRSGYLLLQQL